MLEVTKVCLVLYADKRQRGGQGTGEGKERGWVCKRAESGQPPHPAQIANKSWEVNLWF